MSPILNPGDYVAVSKLIPGPRIFKNVDVFNKHKASIYRLSGLRSINRNDIVVFNFPYALNRNKIQFSVLDFYVKRCIAIPGDTFYIRNGIYSVNTLRLNLGDLIEQQKLAKKNSQDFKPNVYRAINNWTIKDYGPLYLPRSGDNIRIDSTNIKIYKKLIEYETGDKIKYNKHKISLSDSIITYYTFKENYYFMAGDFLSDSKDSRYWGLLPENFIVGKVIGIWWSKDIVTNKIRWERISFL